MNEKILEILDRCPNTSLEQLAIMIDADIKEVGEKIDDMKKNGILLGNKNIINWEKTDKEVVNAIIEVKVAPQRGEGFNKIAERIYKFPEVKTLYLMAGDYDLCVIIEGRTMKEVAMFVADRISAMDSVMSTNTRFVLKIFKYEGISFEEEEKDTRQVITL